MLVNYYKTIHSEPTQVDLYGLYARISSDFKNETDTVLAGYPYNEKKTYQELKTRVLPCVIFSGCYDRHKPLEEQTDVIHTRVMNMDIDLNTEAELRNFMRLIHDNQIPTVEAAALSVSGRFNGSMWINVRIGIPETFEEVSEYLVTRLKLTPQNYVYILHGAFYDAYADMLKNALNIIAGKTKDVKRLRYLNYDPDIYVNYESVYLPLKNVEVYLKSTDKNDRLTQYIDSNNNADPFKIAYSFAKNKMGECVTGNIHNFIYMFAVCLNRMGISETECYNYVTGKLGIDVTTNCVSYPYKAYSSDFGTWQDWKQSQPKEAPTETLKEKTEFVRDYSEDERYFKPLGFNKAEDGVQAFYFYSKDSKSIIRLTASKMSAANLLQLANLNYWEDKFPKNKNGGFNINAAVDWLVLISNNKGIFDPHKIRGRGAWIDKNRILIHNGDHLLINGTKYELGSIDTEYIYELAKPLNLTTANPLRADEGVELVEMLTKLSWSRPVDGWLLSGWLAIAPIVGVLNWRPHVWITGGAGSGKSWVNAAIKRFIGNISVSVQGNTSEAGLRETLVSDAINVLFDEAEGESEQSKIQMEKVLQLMRSASSSDGGFIIKGTGKGAIQYVIRSCFAFFSIVPQAVHGSDTRRITNLELKKGGISDEDFKQIDIRFHEIATTEYIRRFQARMISMIPNLLKTIDIFTTVIARKIGSRAMGDQLGGMIAGVWHILEDEVPTTEIAERFINKFDFSSEQGVQAQSDEQRCLQHILSIQIRVETGTGILTRNLGELVKRATEQEDGRNLSVDVSKETIRRYGLKIEDQNGIEYLCISTTSPFICNQIAKTAWGKNFAQVLNRLQDAKRKNVVYFTTGLKTPAICIPIDNIFNNSDN